jgi:hypothetical protein
VNNPFVTSAHQVLQFQVISVSPSSQRVGYTSQQAMNACFFHILSNLPPVLYNLPCIYMRTRLLNISQYVAVLLGGSADNFLSLCSNHSTVFCLALSLDFKMSCLLFVCFSLDVFAVATNTIDISVGLLI